MALSGLTPGRIFCTSGPLRATEERVVLATVTITSPTWALSPPGAGAAEAWAKAP